jgi:hypothetical protein
VRLNFMKVKLWLSCCHFRSSDFCWGLVSFIVNLPDYLLRFEAAEIV